MTFTYDSALGSSLDQLRFLLGDIEEAGAAFTDEELTWLLTQQVNPTGAASLAARRIAVRYAGRVEHEIGDARVMANQQFEHWMALADSLKHEALLSQSHLPIPFAGGISQGDKDIRQDNDDRAVPYFTRTTADGSSAALGVDEEERP